MTNTPQNMYFNDGTKTTGLLHGGDNILRFQRDYSFSLCLLIVSIADNSIKFVFN